ncbi:unannotated protein [freshwater metagenome]|uniref:Unannotated protein n=1 Tax=freshwater metagenome TaxID=449393 RepID=A0A6J6EG66_9ZZZZ
MATKENPETVPTDARESGTGKGHATPSRKEREAANKRPLVPDDRRAAAKANRATVAAERERARIGMAAGDERYLPRRDRGPQRKFVRDYVDARWNIGELMVPLMLIVIVMTFADTVYVSGLSLAELGVISMWAFIILVFIDGYVLNFLIRRRVKQKFGVENLERGLGWYAAMRALQLRPMRMPKPQVRRGQSPE